MKSSEVFRLWSIIHAIGTAAERRVWTARPGTSNRLFPNLFVFLTGRPASGKTQAMGAAEDLLRRSMTVILSPNDMTKQGFQDELARGPEQGGGPSARRHFQWAGDSYDFTYMGVYISEIANFMPEYDTQLTGFLTDLWDCRNLNQEVKRSRGSTTIPFPGVSLIVCAALGKLAKAIPHDEWSSGFMARVILVYAEPVSDRTFFGTPKSPEEAAKEMAEKEEAEDYIIQGLKDINAMAGPIPWTPDAQALLDEFANTLDTQPAHYRLTDYNARRDMHLIKLCMIAALSKRQFEVTLADVETALSWLLITETTIPLIFANMPKSPDAAMLEQLCYHFKNRDYRNPLTEGEILRWLVQEGASFRSKQLLDLALRSDYLTKVAGTVGERAEYFPNRDRLIGT